MKIKNGIDLVEDQRIIKNLKNKAFINKVFLPQEQIYLNNNLRMVSIFSLKEAVIKALNINTDYWLDIEVSFKESIPQINLSDIIRPANLVSMDSSVSHSNGQTIGIITILMAD